MHEMEVSKHPSDDDCTVLYIYEIAFAEIRFQTFSYKFETHHHTWFFVCENGIIWHQHFRRKLIEEKFCIAVKGPHKGCLRDESYSGVPSFTFSHTKYPQFVTQKTWYFHIFSDVWIFRFSFQKISGINRGEGGLWVRIGGIFSQNLTSSVWFTFGEREGISVLLILLAFEV